MYCTKNPEACLPILALPFTVTDCDTFNLSLGNYCYLWVFYFIKSIKRCNPSREGKLR